MQVRAGADAAEEHHRMRGRGVHQRLGLVQRRVRRRQVAEHDVGDRQVIQGAADLGPLLLLAPHLERVRHQLDRALGAGSPGGLRRTLVVVLQRPAAQRERQIRTQAQHHGLAQEAARGTQPLLEDLDGLRQAADVVEHDAQAVGDAHLQDRILGRARQHHGLASRLQRTRRHAAADRNDAQRVQREGLAMHRPLDAEVGQCFVGGCFGLFEFLAQRERTRQRRQRPRQPVTVAFAAHPIHRGLQRDQPRRAAFLGHTVESAQVVVQLVLFCHSGPHCRGRCRSPRPPAGTGPRPRFASRRHTSAQAPPRSLCRAVTTHCALDIRPVRALRHCRNEALQISFEDPLPP